MSEFEFRTVPLQHTAVVQVTTTPDRIGETMGEAIGKAFAAVGKAGVAPVGPIITKYTAYSEESVSYEIGVPVAAPFAGDGDVVAGQIGGCEAAVGMHVGPYDTLGETTVIFAAAVGVLTLLAGRRRRAPQVEREDEAR